MLEQLRWRLLLVLYVVCGVYSNPSQLTAHPNSHSWGPIKVLAERTMSRGFEMALSRRMEGVILCVCACVYMDGCNNLNVSKISRSLDGWTCQRCTRFYFCSDSEWSGGPQKVCGSEVHRRLYCCIASTYTTTVCVCDLPPERHVIFYRTLVRGNRKAIMKIGWKAMLTKKLRAQLQSLRRIEQARKPAFLKQLRTKFFCCKQKQDAKRGSGSGFTFPPWSLQRLWHGNCEKYNAIWKISKSYIILCYLYEI